MIEEIRLSDLITLQRGFDITKKEQVEGEYPVISSGGISSFHNRFKVKGPGVVIGRKGTLGTVFYSRGDFWPHDTSLWVKDFKGNDPKFVYYLLQVLHLEKFDAGAANPTLNRNHVHSLKLDVPRMEFRSKIASILSAYDDLIENNSQRIQLLEEMAEEIYKEWFVRLRFPGYKQSKFFNKDGKEVPHGTPEALPEGWERKAFENVAKYINGYAFKPDDWGDRGMPIIKIAELKNGVTDKTPRNNGKNVPDKLLVNPGDLLFSWSASLDVYIWGSEIGLLNQHIFKVVPVEKMSKVFLFYSLKGSMSIFRNMSNGATMHHIKRSELSRVFVDVPDLRLMRLFDSLVKPIVDEIILLKNKNQLLQETRDLLLPRLISGKLDVSTLATKPISA